MGIQNDIGILAGYHELSSIIKLEIRELKKEKRKK